MNYIILTFPFKQLTQKLGISSIGGTSNMNGNSSSNLATLQNSKLNADLGTLDMLVTSLLERHGNQQQPTPSQPLRKSLNRSSSTLNRLKSFSFRHRNSSKVPNTGGGTSNGCHDNISDDGGGGSSSSFSQAMPTIMESNGINMALSGITTAAMTPTAAVSSSTTMLTGATERPTNVPTGVRQIINTITNAPHRFSHTSSNKDEENTNLTENMLD